MNIPSNPDMSSCAGAVVGAGTGGGIGADVILGEVRFGFDVMFGTVTIVTLDVTITHHLLIHHLSIMTVNTSIFFH
jgi:hypothetical protein